tara:strand:+ start:955 stop:2553 length:1599 start_codon:yes stop_codon:yes gene_type:complete
MKKNCIFLLLDSITYDAINSEEKSKYLFPNLYQLYTKYNLKKCVSNSNCTQFVLPSLFSLTMPLDEGGYDYGVKNRQITWLEILKQKGYSTLIFSNCNQIGADNGYDRGADENINSFDYRLILEQKMNRVILPNYEKKIYDSKRDKDLLNDYKNLITEIHNKINIADTLIWNNKLKNINFNIKINIGYELNLINKKPETVIKKLLSINPASLWLFLGDDNLSGINFFIKRVFGSINWRIKYMITKSNLPINFLGHKTVNMIDNFENFKNKLKEIKKPFFIYHHVMDLHDYENFNGFNIFFKKLLNYPKWLKHTSNLRRKKKFFYDSTLMLLDEYVGKILKIIDTETVLFITSDHGHRKSLKKQISRYYIDQDKFNEMHGEDLEVPVMSNVQFSNYEKNKELFDTISVSKTVIDILGINISEYSKTINYENQLIISEHSGRGSFDLRKNLYFTISSVKFRMIVSIINDEIFIKFYDIFLDLDETNDVSADESYAKEMIFFFNFLLESRKEILSIKFKSVKKIHNKFLSKTHGL